MKNKQYVHFWDSRDGCVACADVRRNTVTRFGQRACGKAWPEKGALSTISWTDWQAMKTAFDPILTAGEFHTYIKTGIKPKRIV